MPRSAHFAAIAIASSLFVCGLSALLGSAPAIASSAARLGVNLIVDPGADAVPGSQDASQMVKPPGWATTGCLTAVRYGASGGFPVASSPGPKDRGKNMFQGGPGCPVSTASQVIDVSALSKVIDGGHAGYALSGYLGGFSSQADSTTVSVDFQDASGGSLGNAVIGPVTPTQRANTTGLMARSKSGTVPSGTRSIRVTITATRTDGSYNDGSADSLSFAIVKKST